MIPVTRPSPHSTHAEIAAALLAEARQRIAEGGHPDVDKRPMWQLDFEPLARHWKAAWGTRDAGLYKTALAGSEGIDREAKCVWCEQLRSVRGELQVDHFRPKARVSHWVGNPSEDSDDEPEQRQVSAVGYWWLGYAWSNWNLACYGCNGTWKRNIFPRRVELSVVEGVERREEPLLLDPTSTFKTREHFRWDEFGRIYGVSEQGRATIITCGLNRTALKNARMTKLPDILKALGEFIAVLNADSPDDVVQREAKKLYSFGAPTAEFAGMARYFIERRLEREGMAWDEFERITSPAETCTSA